jgi:hypothetical protein
MSTIQASSNSSDEGSRSAGTAKKPYNKPAFRYEQVFVTSALTCSKVGSTGQCKLNPPTSAS